MFFAVVAVLPGALVYGISVQFLASSIESYFDTRIDKARWKLACNWGAPHSISR